MRIHRLALMAGALASLLFAGTAHAATVSAPAFKPVLTKNPLYKAGKLGIQTCEEPPVNHGSVEEAEVYFSSVMDCLKQAWAPVVKKAGYRFSTPKLTVITRVGTKTACGKFPEGAQALYCPNNKSITFLLSPEIVEEPRNLALMQVLAHEYGHHVQQLTGIGNATETFYAGSSARALDGVRRSELQAQCLSAAFVGRVWDSLGRGDAEWDAILKSTHNFLDLSSIGVKVRSGADQTHGKDANNAYWLQRGFKSESASACNTWAAPKAKVL
ncbi:neutral zinc metallopeptidase [Nonomuraea sp. NPDC049400]|uniref:neutral zinc metallopeptidase n=1 Tax=Nonomuraea sp. NPDC049400 TaxID=3364352 RepID=UPI00378EA1B5